MAKGRKPVTDLLLDLESCTFLRILGTYLRLVSFAYGRCCLGSIRTMILHAISAAAALFFCKSQLRGHTKHIQERKKKKEKTSNDTERAKQFLFHAARWRAQHL